MRADAERLLERLNQPDFAYHDFGGRFSDLELWPLFVALLNDRRLSRPGKSRSLGVGPSADGAACTAPPIGARAILGQLAEMAAEGRL